MSTLTYKQQRNAVSEPVRIKARFIAKDMIKKSNLPIEIIYVKDDYLSHGGFNIYLVQGESKTWVDSAKSENVATKKVNELNEWIS